MITLTDRASMVASSMHKSQVRWAADKSKTWTGEPYFNHVRRVADTMRRQDAPEHVVAAAYLHDVVEDGHTNFVELHDDFGFPVMMVALVRVVTRCDTETYDQYIDRVAKNPEAAAIKRADLADNMSTLPSGHSLWSRYLKAMVRLHNV